MIPDDIKEVYALMKLVVRELDGTVEGEEIKEWMCALKDEAKNWSKGKAAPNWNAFREWINDLCDDRHMPRLFVESP